MNLPSHTKQDILSAYKGMTEKQSINHQVTHWAAGISTHNPIRDECCPDFSCCNPSSLLDELVRKRFLEAYLSGDDEVQNSILMMCFGGLVSDKNVYIAGDVPDPTQH